MIPGTLNRFHPPTPRLKLLVSLKSLMTEQEAFIQQWNCTVGVRMGRGNRVANDVFNEYLNGRLIKAVPVARMSVRTLQRQAKVLSAVRYSFT